MAKHKGTEMEAQDMPSPGEYLSAEQKSGGALNADEIFKDTYKWLKSKGCEKAVSAQIIEQYAMSKARWLQCEKAISEYGFLVKHPTSGVAIESPYVSMSQNYMKQANAIWHQILDIVNEKSPDDGSRWDSDFD